MLIPTCDFFRTVFIGLFSLAWLYVLLVSPPSPGDRQPLSGRPYTARNIAVIHTIMAFVVFLGWREVIRSAKMGEAFARGRRRRKELVLPVGQWQWLEPISCKAGDAITLDLSIRNAPDQLIRITVAVERADAGPMPEQPLKLESLEVAWECERPRLTLQPIEADGTYALGIRSDADIPGIIDASARWSAGPRLMSASGTPKHRCGNEKKPV